MNGVSHGVCDTFGSEGEVETEVSALIRSLQAAGMSESSSTVSVPRKSPFAGGTASTQQQRRRLASSKEITEGKRRAMVPEVEEEDNDDNREGSSSRKENDDMTTRQNVENANNPCRHKDKTWKFEKSDTNVEKLEGGEAEHRHVSNTIGGKGLQSHTVNEENMLKRVIDPVRLAQEMETKGLNFEQAMQMAAEAALQATYGDIGTSSLGSGSNTRSVDTSHLSRGYSQDVKSNASSDVSDFVKNQNKPISNDLSAEMGIDLERRNEHDHGLRNASTAGGGRISENIDPLLRQSDAYPNQFASQYGKNYMDARTRIAYSGFHGFDRTIDESGEYHNIRNAESDVPVYATPLSNDTERALSARASSSLVGDDDGSEIIEVGPPAIISDDQGQEYLVQPVRRSVGMDPRPFMQDAMHESHQGFHGRHVSNQFDQYKSNSHDWNRSEAHCSKDGLSYGHSHHISSATALRTTTGSLFSEAAPYNSLVPKSSIDGSSLPGRIESNSSGEIEEDTSITKEQLGELPPRNNVSRSLSGSDLPGMPSKGSSNLHLGDYHMSDTYISLNHKSKDPHNRHGSSDVRKLYLDGLARFQTELGHSIQGHGDAVSSYRPVRMSMPPELEFRERLMHRRHDRSPGSMKSSELQGGIGLNETRPSSSMLSNDESFPFYYQHSDRHRNSIDMIEKRWQGGSREPNISKILDGIETNKRNKHDHVALTSEKHLASFESSRIYGSPEASISRQFSNNLEFVSPFSAFSKGLSVSSPSSKSGMSDQTSDIESSYKTNDSSQTSSRRKNFLKQNIQRINSKSLKAQSQHQMSGEHLGSLDELENELVAESNLEHFYAKNSGSGDLVESENYNEWEISSSEIKLGPRIGIGSFGKPNYAF